VIWNGTWESSRSSLSARHLALHWCLERPFRRNSTLSQAIVVYGLSLFLGVRLNWSPLALLNVFVVVVLAATLFSTFSLIIACIVKTRERFMVLARF